LRRRCVDAAAAGTIAAEFTTTTATAAVIAIKIVMTMPSKRETITSG